ncbi:MAG: ribosome small subunit-dependent GTPase A [Oscillospiraceae bacterium]|jgi:ribosome biogenesis GTPase|nr:ribosome small subunit-dependent GTPase A [Oscillospiraceae bacterium]
MSDSFAACNGIILKGIGGFYYVEAAEGFSLGESVVFECRARGVFRKENRKPLAGDLVVIQPEAGNKGTVIDILPRKNELKRPPVANIDVLMIVSSVAVPSANTLLIDKLTAFACNRGIMPAVVVSKADLDPRHARSLAEIYEKSGIPVFIISCEMPDELERLQGFFEKGKIYAFAGNSGTGKSTLINRLDPSLGLETGEVSEKLGRGRHTTRQVELFHFLSGFLVDTPGFSSFELDRTDLILKEDLADSFTEFAEYSGQCRFTGCAHLGEKGCAVCRAVDEGKIPRSRYKSYAAMYEEVKDIKEWQL